MVRTYVSSVKSWEKTTFSLFCSPRLSENVFQNASQILLLYTEWFWLRTQGHVVAATRQTQGSHALKHTLIYYLSIFTLNRTIILKNEHHAVLRKTATGLLKLLGNCLLW